MVGNGPVRRHEPLTRKCRSTVTADAPPALFALYFGKGRTITTGWFCEVGSIPVRALPSKTDVPFGVDLTAIFFLEPHFNKPSCVVSGVNVDTDLLDKDEFERGGRRKRWRQRRCGSASVEGVERDGATVVNDGRYGDGDELEAAKENGTEALAGDGGAGSKEKGAGEEYNEKDKTGEGECIWVVGTTRRVEGSSLGRKVFKKARAAIGRSGNW
eukprot:CAMPEP_0113559738 /NCGR_PEP_ID=MMETSP0015_2-20120614/19058_1 /TAXON_ID=2838 /ORGANISM="Odontella" /LENGTH=213 /DNA_ID=CAMNT_0000461397 /DNA_START=8 /DNA_END=650 /DNA_ORIENTATION=+ /assembly_acc=CAM_ASM_000160